MLNQRQLISSTNEYSMSFDEASNEAINGRPLQAFPRAFINVCRMVTERGASNLLSN